MTYPRKTYETLVAVDDVSLPAAAGAARGIMAAACYPLVFYLAKRFFRWE
jgi:hypothetical protein